MKEELLKGLTEEQIEKIKNCSNSDELLELAKKEGVELSDEQLQVISGGHVICSSTPSPTCSWCGSKNVKVERNRSYGTLNSSFYCECRNCGHDWWQ